MRHQDVTGVSGVGVVAQGTEWTSGAVTLHWPGDPVQSTGQYRSVEELLCIHGHGGCTEVEWIDRPTPAYSSGNPLSTPTEQAEAVPSSNGSRAT